MVITACVNSGKLTFDSLYIHSIFGITYIIITVNIEKVTIIIARG